MKKQYECRMALDACQHFYRRRARENGRLPAEGNQAVEDHGARLAVPVARATALPGPAMDQAGWATGTPLNLAREAYRPYKAHGGFVANFAQEVMKEQL